MSKNLFLRVVSMVMLFVVCLSANGVVINKHFCRGELKEVALYIDVNGCNGCASHQEVRQTKQNNLSNSELYKGRCCENDSFFNKIDLTADETEWVNDSITWLPVVIIAPEYTSTGIFSSVNVKPAPYLLEKRENSVDLTLLLGRFLI